MASPPLPEHGSAEHTEKLSQRAKKRLANKKLQKAIKRRRTDYRGKQAELRDKYGIKVTGALRIHVEESVHPPRTQQRATGGPTKRTPMTPGGQWEQLILRPLVALPEAGDITHVAIPNPNFKADAYSCRFAALRFNNCMREDQQAALIQRIEAVKDLGANFQVTSAHGTSFQQLWIGNWKPYTAAPRVAEGGCASSGTPLEASLTELVNDIHPIMQDRPARFLEQLDPDAARRMRFNHQVIAKGMAGSVHLQKEKNQRWHAEDASRKNTSNFRLGGMGSMLAVSISTAKGTDFHYDNNDDGHVYSAIVVLGADGNLHLPDVGYKMHVKKGSVVFFPANQLLHKLDIDENAGADPKQFVLTFWTDKRSMDYLEANEQKKDFYGASELHNDQALKHLIKDCYIVQPGSSDRKAQG